MSNILLTGASGFIGSNILNEIKFNNQIFIIQRYNTKKKIKSSKNIKIITFKKYSSLSKKLKKIKVDVVINCATYYKKKHKSEDIYKFIESNILLGNIILENIGQLEAKKFINFSTTWENIFNNGFHPKNLYAAYKNGFNSIINYYKHKFPKIKFINLYIVDTFGKNDNRGKLLDTLRKNFIDNKITKITSKRLYLNLINVVDICDAIKVILNRNISTGQYILKNYTYFNIYKLIKFINKNSKKRLKIKWESNKYIKDKIIKYKKLDNWKPNKSNLSYIKKYVLN